MEPRKASVSLVYNGKNATMQIAEYLNAFSYTDRASGASDSISVTVNDPDHRWIGPWLPEKGDRLEPTIVIENWSGEGSRARFPCGSFTLDKFSFSGNPIKVTIEALALPASSSFKTKERTETYEKTSLKGIGEKVASRAGVSLHFDGADVSIAKVEQNNQDDCEFYAALVEKYGLALKIYNSKLVVFSEAAYEGKQARLTLTPADFEPGWSWETRLDGTYTGVSYQYTNSDKNKTFTVTSGSDERLLSCNEAADNLTEATAIALAALNNANKGATAMSITIMARPGLIASDCIQIGGLGRLDGKYYIESIKHSVGSGYKMGLELRRVEARAVSARSTASTVQESAKQSSGDTGGSAQKPEPNPDGPVKGGQYELKEKKKGYYTAAEALAGTPEPGHPTGWRNPGTYWIFNTSQGMLNLSTAKEVPGSWINPG